MRSAVFTACLFVLGLAGHGMAQLPGPGLTWSGSGGSAGSYLPTCASLPVVAVRNEKVDLRVWGDPNAPFVLFAASATTQCLQVPGLGNGLVLAFPVFPIAAGSLTRTSPCLSCPPGYESLPLTVPQSLLTGTAVSFQAVSFGANKPALTVAITAKVR